LAAEQDHYATCGYRTGDPCDCPLSDDALPPGFAFRDGDATPSYVNYTAREVAEALGITERTVRRWIEAGRLNATKEHGAFRIDISEARTVLSESRAGTSHGRASLQERVAWLETENARLWHLLERAVSR
jgi:excisionase family DNA binding protein